VPFEAVSAPNRDGNRHVAGALPKRGTGNFFGDNRDYFGQSRE
jgi:hypothetical protein